MQRVIEKGPLTEAQTKLIVHQLLQAVAFSQKRMIAHRDITPDTIFFCSRTPERDDFAIKLSGFRYAMGTSKTKLGSLNERSYYFLPPEVTLEGKDTYNNKIDTW